MNYLYSFLIILPFMMAQNVMAQNVKENDHHKIEEVRILKVGDSYRRCIVNIDITPGIERLQKFLSYVVFRSREATIIKGYNDFLNLHEASPLAKDSLNNKKDVKCEILLKSRMTNKFYYVHIAIPEYYVWSMQPNDIKLRVVERDFIYDVEKEQILTYKDIFSNNYKDPFVADFLDSPERTKKMIESRNTSYEDSIFVTEDMVWNYVLGDDYIEYTPFAFKGKTLTKKKTNRMLLVHCKDYLNPTFREKIDWNKFSIDIPIEDNQVIQKQKYLEKEQKREMMVAMAEIEEEEEKEKKGQTYAPSLVNIYANDNDSHPFDDMHFYFSEKEHNFYLTGMNKKIIDINEEDFAILKEKKLHNIIYDINLLRDVIKGQGQKVYAIDDKLLTKKPKYIKGKEKFEKELSMSFSSAGDNAHGSVTFSIIVDNNGDIHAPTITEVSGTSSKKLKSLKNLTRKLRRLKMQPGEIGNGEKVYTMSSYTFWFMRPGKIPGIDSNFRF